MSNPYARQWDAPEPEPVPPPQIRATPIDTALIPTSARRLVAKLGDGWRHVCTYARGPVLTAQGVPGRTEDSVAVRMRHASGIGAVAIFLGGKFTTGYTWTICTDPDCPRAGREHPSAIAEHGYRALVTVLTDPTELEVAA